MESYSLYQLNRKLKETLKNVVPSSLWVRAEIHSLSINYSGHCYIDLIEKSANGDQIIAKQRATIWSYAYQSISSKFEQITGQTLHSGLNILIEVSVEFHELYGLSFNIKNIDPTYTLGELQRRRIEIIERLRKRGLIEKNKLLTMPTLPQRIAIISSPTAAGYNDFIHQLINNQYHLIFNTTLFPAIMQGTQTEESIISAMSEIAIRQKEFDVVVIIRGGGSTSDLQAFDSERLAEKCAMFPLPIITGIGHLKDESVLDMVAYRSLKTPTAVAEYMISLELQLLKAIENLGNKINIAVKQQIEREKIYLMKLMQYLPQQTIKLISQSKIHLNELSHQIGQGSKEQLIINNRKLDNTLNRIKLKASSLFINQKNMLDSKTIIIKAIIDKNIKVTISKLEIFETKIKLLDPKNILNKGYSFTVKNGKIVKSSEKLEEGDLITTTFADGEIDSIVTKK